MGEVFGENFAADFKALKEKLPGGAGAADLDDLVRKCVSKCKFILAAARAMTCRARDQMPGELPQQLRWPVRCRRQCRSK